MHQCIKFILFWNDTLHVSDGISVHHQEFKTVHLSNRYCRLLATRWNSVPSHICLTNACCCMYSLELLMMDVNTVRNM